MKEGKAIAILAVSSCVAVFDAIFKYFAITRLPDDGSRVLSPIDFALHKNPGIAFDIPVPLSIVIAITVIISIILVAFAWKNRNTRPMAAAASSMIVIGSFGNMVDRIINNFTTDYIIILGTSAINLSDILIVLGAILLIIYTKTKDAS